MSRILNSFNYFRVVFVGSAPTTAQSSTNGFQWGLKKMEKALRTIPQNTDIDPSWPLVMQCSSIGTWYSYSYTFIYCLLNIKWAEMAKRIIYLYYYFKLVLSSNFGTKWWMGSWWAGFDNAWKQMVTLHSHSLSKLSLTKY